MVAVADVSEHVFAGENVPVPDDVNVIVPDAELPPVSVTVAVQVVPWFAMTGDPHVTDVAVVRRTDRPKASLLVS